MFRSRTLLIFSLTFNILVLVPVVSTLLLDLPNVDRAFGSLTDGRLILTSVYMAIAIVSAALIGVHLKRLSWAVPMTVALLSVQVVYKLITVPMVGLSNPVVITNLVVVAVHGIALGKLWLEKRP